jgi:carbamoyltransferase
MHRILGISAYYHDAAAALVIDGRIVAAAQEERFSRRKNDERFPALAVAACLRQAQLHIEDVDIVVFYDKPITKFARLLETYLTIAPRGLRSFLDILPNWLGEKLNLRRTLRDELPGLREDCVLQFTEHHLAHAASAFYPSPFESAAILTVDGVGEYATTTVGRGEGRHIQLLQQMTFPHSLGLLYSAFTAYCGFRVNSGEYKLMGLAPYGEPRYVQAILDELIDVRPDGSFRLCPVAFEFLKGRRMTGEQFHRLLGGPPRPPDAPLEQRHADVARSIQAVTEDILLRLARHACEQAGSRRLCLAGGVALNCVANGRILREAGVSDLWVQPAAGDAGGSLGAALMAWHQQTASFHNSGPSRVSGQDQMQGALLGPAYSDDEIEAVLRQHQAVYRRLSQNEILNETVALLQQERVIGWFQGRMEFGPRALGNRSILADPRSSKIQSTLNLKVKFRESFRPFAPVVRRDRVSEFFELDGDSPYMLLVAQVQASLRRPIDPSLRGFDRLKDPHSTLPAITHVDGSARIQTVTNEQNPLLDALLERFEAATGCPVLVNTSFNVRGEPVVGSPDDAYRCFVHTGMDHLVIGSFLLDRVKQPVELPPQTYHPVPD